jgi:hypothetical protein
VLQVKSGQLHTPVMKRVTKLFDLQQLVNYSCSERLLDMRIEKIYLNFMFLLLAEMGGLINLFRPKYLRI